MHGNGLLRVHVHHRRQMLCPTLNCLPLPSNRRQPVRRLPAWRHQLRLEAWRQRLFRGWLPAAAWVRAARAGRRVTGQCGGEQLLEHWQVDSDSTGATHGWAVIQAVICSCRRTVLSQCLNAHRQSHCPCHLLPGGRCNGAAARERRHQPALWSHRLTMMAARRRLWLRPCSLLPSAAVGDVNGGAGTRWAPWCTRGCRSRQGACEGVLVAAMLLGEAVARGALIQDCCSSVYCNQVGCSSCSTFHSANRQWLCPAELAMLTCSGAELQNIV